MRFYGYASASFYTYLILILAGTETSQDIIEKHYNDQRRKTDTMTPSNSKVVQLYSKNGKFVQVLKRVVNAKGIEDSDAVTLVLESETFGKVRIRHYYSNYYICMNAKGEIIGLSEKKGKRMKRCVFNQKTAQDTFTQFVSDKYGIKEDQPRYLAFRHSGEPKPFTSVSDSRQRATKFMIYDINKPKRRHERHVRRRRIKPELLLQEKKGDKRHVSRVCSRYFACLRKIWKMKKRANVQRTIFRCSRVFRRRKCRRKCAKQ